MQSLEWFRIVYKSLAVGNIIRFRGKLKIEIFVYLPVGRFVYCKILPANKPIDLVL